MKIYLLIPDFIMRNCLHFFDEAEAIGTAVIRTRDKHEPTMAARIMTDSSPEHRPIIKSKFVTIPTAIAQDLTQYATLGEAIKAAEGTAPDPHHVVCMVVYAATFSTDVLALRHCADNEIPPVIGERHRDVLEQRYRSEFGGLE